MDYNKLADLLFPDVTKLPADVEAVTSVTAISKDALLSVSYALTDIHSADHSITLAFNAFNESAASAYNLGSKIPVNALLFGK